MIPPPNMKSPVVRSMEIHAHGMTLVSFGDKIPPLSMVPRPLDALLYMGTFLACPQAVALAYAVCRPQAHPSGISKVMSKMSRDTGDPAIGINDFGVRVELAQIQRVKSAFLDRHSLA
jgi:hypothetical protein